MFLHVCSISVHVAAAALRVEIRNSVSMATFTIIYFLFVVTFTYFSLTFIFLLCTRHRNKSYIVRRMEADLSYIISPNIWYIHIQLCLVLSKTIFVLFLLLKCMQCIMNTFPYSVILFPLPQLMTHLFLTTSSTSASIVFTHPSPLMCMYVQACV